MEVVIPHNWTTVIIRYKKAARDKWPCYWLKWSKMTLWFISDCLNNFNAYRQCQKAILKLSFAKRMLLLTRGMTPTLSECQRNSLGNCVCWLAGNPSVSQWYGDLACVECDFILLRIKKLYPWNDKCWICLLGVCDCCVVYFIFFNQFIAGLRKDLTYSL